MRMSSRSIWVLGKVGILGGEGLQGGVWLDRFGGNLRHEGLQGRRSG
jgi:hypothetical protein